MGSGVGAVCRDGGGGGVVMGSEEEGEGVKEGVGEEDEGMGAKVSIEYRVVGHGEQRYATVGDWEVGEEGMVIRVSEMGEGRYNLLVFIHELIEAMMCKEVGVGQGEVDEFDREYEEARAQDGRRLAPCECGFYEEPGDDPHAPYHVQHMTATKCEKIIAKALGVEWEEYEAAIGGLFDGKA